MLYGLSRDTCKIIAKNLTPCPVLDQRLCVHPYGAGLFGLLKFAWLFRG